MTWLIDLLTIALLISLFHAAFVSARLKKQLNELSALNCQVGRFIEQLGKDQEIFVDFKLLKLYSVNRDENTATIKFNTPEDLQAFIESRDFDIEIKVVRQF